MYCKQVKDNLPQYIENELPNEIKIQIDKHIKQCNDCQKEIQAYEKSWDILGVWEDYIESPEFIPFKIEKNNFEKFTQKLLSLLTFRFPAWSVALLILISLFTGLFISPYHQKASPKIVYIYKNKDTTNNDLTALEIISPTSSLWFPNSTGIITTKDYVLSKNNNNNTSSIEWESTELLNRIDIKSIFNI